jgi:hypothetical protein
LELELVNTEANSAAAFNQSAEYLKLSPLGKIPAFEGANGFTLSESIAIAVYGMFQFASTSLFHYQLRQIPLHDEQFLLLVIPGRTTVLITLQL